MSVSRIQTKTVSKDGTTYQFQYASHYILLGDYVTEALKTMMAAAEEMQIPIFTELNGVSLKIAPEELPEKTEAAQAAFIEQKIEKSLALSAAQEELRKNTPDGAANDFVTAKFRDITRSQNAEDCIKGWEILKSLNEADDVKVMQAMGLMAFGYHDAAIVPPISFAGVKNKLNELGYVSADHVPRETRDLAKEINYLNAGHAKAVMACIVGDWMNNASPTPGYYGAKQWLKDFGRGAKIEESVSRPAQVSNASFAALTA
jgi:hypothetical protein